jgi:hypothetical protein
MTPPMSNKCNPDAMASFAAPLGSASIRHSTGIGFVLAQLPIETDDMPEFVNDRAFLWKCAQAAVALANEHTDGNRHSGDLLQIMLITLVRLHRTGRLVSAKNPRTLALAYAKNAVRDYLRKQYSSFRRQNGVRWWEKRRFEELPQESGEHEDGAFRLPVELIVTTDMVAAMDLMMPNKEMTNQSQEAA